MLISNISENSELYNTFAAMGILCTEEKRIRDSREHIGQTFSEVRPLSYMDIERVGYYYPNFFVDVEKEGKFEVWIGDEYINPAEVQWIKNEIHLWGVLPRDYDIETQVATIIYNDCIVDRYSNSAKEPGEYTHRKVIDTRVYPYSAMEHPERCAYYIADGKIKVPEITRPNEYQIEFVCKYTQTIDLVLCSNLNGVFNAQANIGVYVDNPYSNRCYHKFLVDNDPAYQVDARFYPCVKVDKDCTIRVYSDNYTYVPCPETSRILLYPEFIDVKDPYNTDNEYLINLDHVDDIIMSTDSEDTILDKFSRIAAYCYRAWEKFPFFCNEQSDFLMCDNMIFGKPTFFATRIARFDGTKDTYIISSVPFESYRDLLFYQGNIYSDYQIIKLSKTQDSGFVESEHGVPTYVLPSDMNPDSLTILKFNAAEDTSIMNIGDYINEENIVKLHTKLNRFYRNLLILRGSVDDFTDDMKVRVSTTKPKGDSEETDGYLWFELLVNAVPEMFENNAVEVIKSFGLDPDNIPESLKVGMYTLGLDPDNGPEEYTQLLHTYFNLGKAQKKFLVFQYGDGVDDPRIKVYHDIKYGKTPENPEMNDLHVDDPRLDHTESINEYDSTTFTPSDDEGSEGDVNIEGPPVSDEIKDLLDGVSFFPNDMYTLDTISYVNEETGKTISGEDISSLNINQKRNLVLSYIRDGNDAEQENVRLVWSKYLENMDEDTLNIAVYKILLTDYVYSNLDDIRNASELAQNRDKKVIMSLDEPIEKDIGNYWIEIPGDAPPPVVSEAKKHNLTVIMQAGEPDLEEIGALWIDINGLTLQDYIDDIIGDPIRESSYDLPEGFFDGKSATTVFDFGAHGEEGQELEIFTAVDDRRLHSVQYGSVFAGEPDDGDIWFEFLDEIDNRVCYSDTESMVIKVNERLMLLQFDRDNVTAFMFDDIVLNFHGKLGIKYLSILADLVNSGVIDVKDINIFYKRLVTGKDLFEPGLMRLYTGRSHVISTAKIDTTDYSITYSTNIGRYHIDYDGNEVTNREREAAYRMVIDYSRRDISFLGDRMMLFVNGRYIPRTEYKEITAGKIQLLNFNEVIACVDFFYSKKDYYLSRAKKIAIKYWNAPDTSVSIQRPERDYAKMVPMHVCDKTYRGFYDVLLEEFILNGRLLRTLRYMEEHPDEAEYWQKDLVRKFHAISDRDVVGITDDEARIIIPGFIFGDETPIYTINQGDG